MEYTKLIRPTHQFIFNDKEVESLRLLGSNLVDAEVAASLGCEKYDPDVIGISKLLDQIVKAIEAIEEEEE